VATQLGAKRSELYHTLGLTLARQGKLDDAGAAFRQALGLRPEFAEAHNSLGNTLLRQQKHEEACTAYRQAIALRPGYAQAQCNLGIALLQQERMDEALACIQEALRLDPEYLEAEYNLGTALRRLGCFDEAVAAYEHVLAKKPKHGEAHCGLGAARLHQGMPEEAMACFDRALEIRPDDPDFRTNRALTLLLLGDFERGWEEYEWRLKQKRVQPRLVPQPAWDGRPLPQGTILLFAEQGMGDTIQFTRYARLVKERVGTVLLECPAALRGLLAGCPGIDGVVDEAAPAPVVDVQLPLASLPRIFGTRPDTIPATVPYLFTEAAMRERWRELRKGEGSREWGVGRDAGPARPAGLADSPRGVTVAQNSQLPTPYSLSVGIVWQGNPKLPGDPFRSVKLTQFAPIARVPKVILYSLQKGTGVEQLTGLEGAFELVDLGGRLASDFRDTAAAIENLDLVIAVDTSVAHLAGALAKPVWLLLPYYPDWRWQRDREDSPWYPTARLFRQRRPGDWGEVFERVAAALGELTQQPRRRTLTIELDAAQAQELLALAGGVTAERLRRALAAVA
jgi:Flp pilus assembly protein TadD